MGDRRKIKVSITVDEGYLERADELAKKDERTRSQIFDFALREYLARHPIADANNLPPAPVRGEKKAG